MATQWVDFKALRESLQFSDVLRHYNVEIKAKGKQHHGLCPLPGHKAKQRSPSFSANLEKGIFQCFHCGAKGNLLDFAILMGGGNPDNSDDVRKTALHLRDVFGMTEAEKPKARERVAAPSQQEFTETLVNAPLNFELKTLDFNHPYLRNRGFTDETIQEFGLGFCSKGYHAGRIVIPLHNQSGQLLGYAGRVVDDGLISEGNPRYKFPGERDHKGIKYQFSKSEFVYGGYRIKEPVDNLIVVESFTSLWWLHQNGILNVVALMGWSASEAQAKLIVSSMKPDGRVWLMPDGDESGERCAENVLPKVSPHRFIRWVKLEKDKQPTDYDGVRLRELLHP